MRDGAKPVLIGVGIACLLAVRPGIAQNDRTGVSHPDDSVITADTDVQAAPATPKPKPSAAIPATPANSDEVYGSYVPYHAPGTPAPAPVKQEAAFDPDAGIVTEATAGQSQRRLLAGPTNSGDPDAGIVTRVPLKDGEVPDGTIIKARLQEDLSTVSTKAGTRFTARVSEPMMRDGKVIVPRGSVLEGRVTWVRSGKRIGGAAALHLEPRLITLPDGSQYLIGARVIDTGDWDDTKVDNEGTILRSDHSKQTFGVMGLAAGGPMAAGAILGGVPGALIGAGIGAGVDTMLWLKQDHQTELPKDLELVFSLTEPMSITPLNAGVHEEKRDTGGE